MYVQDAGLVEVSAGSALELDGERYVVQEVREQVVRCRPAVMSNEEDDVLDITGEGSGSGDVAVMDGDGDIELPLADARLLVCSVARPRASETAGPAVGDRVRVYWTYMREWYGGAVTECDVDVVGGVGCRILYDGDAERPAFARASGAERPAPARQKQ